jgi:hypothetical protein
VAVKNRWISTFIWMFIIAVLNMAGGSLVWDLVFGLAIAALTLTVMLRFGLLSTAVMLFYLDLMTRLPVTLDTRSWYIGPAVMTLTLIGGLTAYGFVVATARRHAFGRMARVS